jgi:hypothetical protein
MRISRSVFRARCRTVRRCGARAQSRTSSRGVCGGGQVRLSKPRRWPPLPRLYVDSLNTIIDQQTVRISALNNRVPGAVLTLEVIGVAVALGLLGFFLSVLGRGLLPMIFAAALVTMLLLVTFDLDRPTGA